jgi:predicted ATP-grasp superfamily ATP-dependent carboligase
MSEIIPAATADRKRRLRHYAVIWQDGKPVAICTGQPSRAPVRTTIKTKIEA